VYINVVQSTSWSRALLRWGMICSRLGCQPVETAT